MEFQSDEITNEDSRVVSYVCPVCQTVGVFFNEENSMTNQMIH